MSALNCLAWFLQSDLLSVLAWPVAYVVGTKFQILDHPAERKIHSIPTLRTGGVVILLGFFIPLLWASMPEHRWFAGLGTCAIGMFAIGLIEDAVGISPRVRLIMQALCAYLFIEISGISLADLGILLLPESIQKPFTVLAIVGVLNAYNFIDGINGLAAGTGILATLALGALAYLAGDADLLQLTLFMAGALSGFLIFNLMGRVFMGDSGSYFTGFMLAVLSILLVVRNDGISPFAPFLIVFLPFFDAVFAIYRRKRRGREIMKADGKHLHHVLRRRYRSDRKALTTLLGLQLIMLLTAVAFHGNTAVLLVAVLVIGLFIGRLWVKRIEIGGFSL